VDPVDAVVELAFRAQVRQLGGPGLLKIKTLGFARCLIIDHAFSVFANLAQTFAGQGFDAYVRQVVHTFSLQKKIKVERYGLLRYLGNCEGAIRRNVG
jgi:hypothetical protein